MISPLQFYCKPSYMLDSTTSMPTFKLVTIEVMTTFNLEFISVRPIFRLESIRGTPTAKECSELVGVGQQGVTGGTARASPHHELVKHPLYC